jgi:aspartate aminotransferase
VGKPSAEIADEILRQTHVVVEDGGFYGPRGAGHLRICFGSESYEVIEKAMDRLQKYFDGV